MEVPLSTLRTTIAFCTLAATVAVSVSGCVVSAPPPPPPQRVVYVQSAPPTEIYEQAPPSPGPGWVWQKGHWRWNGNRYYWVHGHWVQRPPQASIWIAPHWQGQGGGWMFVEGHWQ